MSATKMEYVNKYKRRLKDSWSSYYAKIMSTCCPSRGDSKVGPERCTRVARGVSVTANREERSLGPPFPLPWVSRDAVRVTYE